MAREWTPLTPKRFVAGFNVWGPEWVRLGQNDRSVIFLDENSKTTPEKGILRFWLKAEFTQRGRAEAQRSQSLSKELFYQLGCIEIRCAY
jgi:hypothetical protein